MKNFECPECSEVSTTVEWDNATENVYGEELDGIESNYKNDCMFICPSCSEYIDGMDIERVYI